MPETTKYYRPELDMLRFFAFFGVFLHHTLSLNTGDYTGIADGHTARILSSIANACGFGLPLFFFLSAFLICTLLLLEKREARTIAIKDFYVRRVLRIWPLYFLAILLAMAVAWYGHMIGYHTRSEFGMAAWFSMFLGNWFFITHPFNGNPFEPLWSISVEEQFYCLVPLMLLAIPIRRVGWLAGLLLGTSALVLYGEGTAHLSVDRQIWANTFSQLMFLAAGILAAWGMLRFRGVASFLDSRSTLWRIVTLGAALLCFFLAAYRFEAKENALSTAGLPVLAGYALAMAGCMLLFAAAYGIRRAPPVLVFLGKISFGLYVFHMFTPFLIEAAIHEFGLPPIGSKIVVHAVSLPLTVGLAWLSYEKFEKGFLRLRERFTHVRNRPA